MRLPFVFCLLGVLLAACAAPATLPPLATPQILTVEHTPAVRTWQPALYACAATIPDMRLLLKEVPTARLSGGEQISIRLGVPSWEQDYFAAQIGEEQLVIVVNPQNPLSGLSAEALRRLYTGQLAEWSELGVNFEQPVQVWDYPAGEDLNQVFTAALWEDNPQVILANLAPDPAAMLEVVSADPGALGYLPRSWLEESDLLTIPIDPDLAAALRQPVLLLTAEEPQGLLRAWLGCLQ